MATIEEIRADHHAIITQPAGAGTPLIVRCWRCREVWPCDTVRVLAALDEANTQIARDAPLLAAVREWHSARQARIAAMGSEEYWGKEAQEDLAAASLLAQMKLRRAATTPQEGGDGTN